MILATAVSQAYGESAAKPVSVGVRKLADVVIYKDDQFYRLVSFGSETA